MVEERFENFSILIMQLSKLVQKIKNQNMKKYGLKAVHVMCVYFLNRNRDGLSNAELCKLTVEDKAAISRALNLLKEKGYIDYEEKKYNGKAILTDSGIELAREIEKQALKGVSAGTKGINIEKQVEFYETLKDIAVNLVAYHQSNCK